MKPYNYDVILDEDADQETTFESIALPCCKDLLDGFNSTIFVYGQTGAGKSFTMLGIEGKDAHLKFPKLLGLVPRSVMLIMGNLASKLGT
eukprot:UN06636